MPMILCSGASYGILWVLLVPGNGGVLAMMVTLGICENAAGVCTGRQPSSLWHWPNTVPDPCALGLPNGIRSKG